MFLVCVICVGWSNFRTTHLSAANINLLLWPGSKGSNGIEFYDLFKVITYIRSDIKILVIIVHSNEILKIK